MLYFACFPSSFNKGDVFVSLNTNKCLFLLYQSSSDQRQTPSPSTGFALDQSFLSGGIVCHGGITKVQSGHCIKYL
jgi:hypothetical protein